MKIFTEDRKGKKLKIRFAQETRFGLPTCQTLRSWTQCLPGTGISLRALAVAERKSAGGRGID